MLLSAIIDGEEVARVKIRQLGATTPSEADNPGGERLYQVLHRGTDTQVVHHRRDGALVLARKALQALEDEALR